MRVEEYKRPTFEVTLKEPSSPLCASTSRLALSGEARYYFSVCPVTAGQARYTVTREPVYPVLVVVVWPWRFQAQDGHADDRARQWPMSADGGFEVKFLPEAEQASR